MPRYSPRTGQLETYQVGPFDSSHIYVQWGGKLPGNESWTCGLRLRKKAGAAVITDAATLLVGISGAIATMHQKPAVNLGSGAKLSFVKVNTIGINGLYLDGGGTNEATYGDVAGGGSVAQVFPNQVTIAVSLMTGFSRGPAHAGRFYLPCFNAPLGTDGLVPATSATALRQEMDTFLAALNAVNAGFEVAIFSRKAGAPGNRRVTGTQVGRVLDTQRRRRRSMTEDYK